MQAAATDAQHARAASVREGLRALIAANNAKTVASPPPDGLDPAARSAPHLVLHGTLRNRAKARAAYNRKSNPRTEQ